MVSETHIIEKAEFNPSIKTYILLVVAFFVTLSIIGIPLLLVWFFGLGQYISGKFYNSLHCQLTERHLEFKKGVLFKKEKTIPLENIQDLTFIQNPLLSLLDLRILKIETAGQSSPQGMSDMRLVGIVDAINFKAKVLDQRTKIIREDRSGSTIPSTDKNMSIELLQEIRDLLKELNNKVSNN